MAHENVIEMRDITKVFGGFVANDKINLHLRKGEIHALLGENGLFVNCSGLKSAKLEKGQILSFLF
ncbi:ABC transporter ATP-binding protein [Streptococcus pneumoniae]|nr:ABC transporter ATP-binding protein [Streptococcus pneumoniae]